MLAQRSERMAVPFPRLGAAFAPLFLFQAVNEMRSPRSCSRTEWESTREALPRGREDTSTRRWHIARQAFVVFRGFVIFLTPLSPLPPPPKKKHPPPPPSTHTQAVRRGDRGPDRARQEAPPRVRPALPRPQVALRQEPRGRKPRAQARAVQAARRRRGRARGGAHAAPERPGTASLVRGRRGSGCRGRRGLLCRRARR